MNLTVLLPTFNRAESLRITLSHFCRIDRTGLNVELIIIDNNSNDDTKPVAMEFKKNLPIIYHFEASPGKNFALNSALDAYPMHEVLVFTDDDITPRSDWLQAIAHHSKIHADFDVFGGSIFPIWPTLSAPGWANSPFLRQVFTEHCLCPHSQTIPYSGGSYPCGANLWIRRAIFEKGYRFNPTIGPKPIRKIMGSETSFLFALRHDGYNLLHAPSASVGHRIKPEEMSLRYVEKRIRLKAKSKPIVCGLQRQYIYDRSHLLWLCFKACCIIRTLLSLGIFCIPRKNKTILGVLFFNYLRILTDFYEIASSFSIHSD